MSAADAPRPTPRAGCASRCPVCNGAGHQSRPPWVAGDVTEWTTGGSETYPCRACNSTGIVWPPASAPAATPEPVVIANAGWPGDVCRACGEPFTAFDRRVSWSVEGWKYQTIGPIHEKCQRYTAAQQDALTKILAAAKGDSRPAAPTGEEAETPLVPGFPRRNQMLHWTTGERAIYDAVQVVEHMGADVRLTDAVILLGKARDRVADFVDGVAPESSAASGIPDIPELDATDGAHPAWWRGCDHGVEQTCRIIGAILDGDPGPHHFGSKKLTALAARLTTQATALAALRARVEEIETLLRAFVWWDEEDEDAPNRWDLLDTLFNTARAALAPRQPTGDQG